MMSVKESDIGWSWFVFFFVFHAVTSAAAALVTTQLYDSSSALLLFIFWEFTFLAIICFSFFLASLFSKATRATLVSLLVFFVGYFLTLVVNYQTSPVGVIFLIALHPVGAFSFGLQEIGRLEDLGVGLSFDTITQTDSPNGYTFANSKCIYVIYPVANCARLQLLPNSTSHCCFFSHVELPFRCSLLGDFELVYEPCRSSRIWAPTTLVFPIQVILLVPTHCSCFHSRRRRDSLLP
jgi:hypothetical protein